MRANPKKAIREKRKYEDVKKETVNQAVDICLILLYASLIDEFKFTPEKLNKVRKRMDRYADYLADGKLNTKEMKGILEKQGVDMRKIGVM